ncbi:MAG: DsbA family oxidoreductase [Nitrospira sp.]|nr:DsbA family oxidoreductase [Nitrospira sp.]
MNERMLRIDIYSDVICPWCYVGKRRLEKALSLLDGTLRTKVTWRPFQLNPTMPKEGMERTEYLTAKFGSVETYVRVVEDQIVAAGSDEPIPFAFGKIARTPNTFLAHRLIWYGEQQGCQNELVELLFKSYFQNGADIGSRDVLAGLAEQVGLTAEAFVFGDEGTAEVQSEEAVGRRLGIRSVPCFVLDQTYSIQGAQPAEQLADAIHEVWSNKKTN